MSEAGFEHFSGTMPVSARQQFPLDALAAWMTTHVDGFSGPLALEQFKGGQSNPTFKLITPAATYVMRSKPAPVAKLLPSAHAIEREFQVIIGLPLWGLFEHISCWKLKPSTARFALRVVGTSTNKFVEREHFFT